MRAGDATLTSPGCELMTLPFRGLVLTVLWHPTVALIGHQALWPEDARDWSLQRFEPRFCAPGAVSGEPLGLQVISRQGLRLRRLADGSVLLIRSPQRMRIEVTGQAMGAGAAGSDESTVLLSAERLSQGVVLGLGGTVLLCLHRSDRLPRRESPSSLIGVSSAMIRVREQIRQVAPSRLPVLLLAESGSGKELAAQEIHALSGPSGAGPNGPFVAINMATLGEHTAAAELFGAARGAYTGAQATRRGLFAAAGEGSLFLDEIGDTPPSVQPMLLRVLDAGDYRPLGASHVERSRARILAATDRPLDSSAFNQPLLRRLEAYTVRIPPLRERREDIGLLMMHLLPAPQAAIAGRLGWAFLTALCLHDWPGNVRQLANVLRRAAMQIEAGETADLDFAAESMSAATTALQTNATSSATATDASTSVGPLRALGDPLTPTSAKIDDAPRWPVSSPFTAAETGDMPPVRLPPAALSDDQVVAALDRHGWCVQRAAQALRISRPSLYGLMQRSLAIRDATEVPEPELRAAFSLGQGQARPLEACATALKVPKQSLRRRLRALGLGFSETPSRR